jgi:hypothetical protein
VRTPPSTQDSFGCSWQSLRDADGSLRQCAAPAAWGLCGMALYIGYSRVTAGTHAGRRGLCIGRSGVLTASGCGRVTHCRAVFGPTACTRVGRGISRWGTLQYSRGTVMGRPRRARVLASLFFCRAAPGRAQHQRGASVCASRYLGVLYSTHSVLTWALRTPLRTSEQCARFPGRKSIRIFRTLMRPEPIRQCVCRLARCRCGW